MKANTEIKLDQALFAIVLAIWAVSFGAFIFDRPGLELTPYSITSLLD